MDYIAVCDDCARDRSFLIDHIRRNHIDQSGLKICEYDSGGALLSAMKDIVFALIFLDMLMQGMNGDETARKIREIDTNVVLIFNTGYMPSTQSFEVQPYRYIVKNKPIAVIDRYIDEALIKMLEKVRKPSLLVHIAKRQIVIKVEDIIYIEKYKKNLRVHITEKACKRYNIQKDKNGDMPVLRHSDKLEQVYEKLGKTSFGYPHSSYIINFDYIVSSSDNSFFLEGMNQSFQISRSKAVLFNIKKNRYMCAAYGGALKPDI